MRQRSSAYCDEEDGSQGCRVALGYREVDVCFERVPRTARWISAVPLTSEGAGSGGLCLPDENSAAATLVHPGATSSVHKSWMA